MKKSKEILKSQKGIALILAIFTVVLISYLVVEISYETNVEYLVNANSISRLKAQYAARSGLELSLLRLKIFTKVKRQYGKQLGAQAKLLDLIWTFPFAWPVPSDIATNSADKELIDSATKESQMSDVKFGADIYDEGSKIDINDLASESKKVAEITKKNLLNLFEGPMKDQKFINAHPRFRPEEMIENIKDWVDSDTQSSIRGSESEVYSQVPGQENQELPPNRAFRSIEELRFVPGMDEEIFNILKGSVTVYGMKAINPNYASLNILMSMDKSITKEIAEEIDKRRTDEAKGGPFKDGSDHCKSDFWGFVNGKGARVDQATIDDLPLQCDSVANFRIKAYGKFGGVTKEIEAVVYDVKMGAQIIAEAVKKEKAQNTPVAPGAPTPTPAPSTGPVPDPLPKGPPRVVYYGER